MILSRVRRTILDHGLIPAGSRVLVGCSGGPDSAALLRALTRLSARLGYRVEAASVDHGLRPDAAQDVEVAARQAEREGVPFHRLRVQVEPGASLQDRARAARYAALGQLARQRQASRVAVGHTLDDQAETVLARILRGTGVSGLGGIQVARADGVVRPLLECRRADVHAYAARHFPELAQDPSNRDPRFLRARIRNQLLPMLLEEDPALVSHLTQLADDARSLATLADHAAQELLHQAQTLNPGTLRERLTAAPVAVRRAVLRGWCLSTTGHTPGRAQLEAMDAAVQHSGQVWLTGGWILLADRTGGVRLERRAQGRA